MIIVYCDKCGKRVTETDLGEGRAVETKPNCWLCPVCAPALAPRAERPKTAPNRITATLKRDRNSPARSAASASQSYSMTQIAVACGGVAAVLIVTLLVVFNRGGTPNHAGTETKAAAPAPADLVRKTEPTARANPVNTHEKTALPVTSLPSAPNPTVPTPAPTAELTRAERLKEADKEMEEMRDRRAATVLDEHKAWFKLNTNDPWEYRDRLRTFVGSYRATRAGAEAIRLLEDYKSLPAAPDKLLISAPESKDYQVVFDLDLAKLGKTFEYEVDNRSWIKQPFDRIAYFVELTTASGSAQYVYVSVDAFTDNLNKIGVPVLATDAKFQQNLTAMNVYSNVEGITLGVGLAGGNIEFWSNNYTAFNAANVPDASNDKYDFGDNRTEPADGYGCMQIHNHDAKQTLFAINHWREGANADLGIGNQSNGNPDWTFANNASTYSRKRLRVLVHFK